MIFMCFMNVLNKSFLNGYFLREGTVEMEPVRIFSIRPDR